MGRKRRSERHRGRIGPASPQRGDITLQIDTLKACDDWHTASVELGFQRAQLDILNAGLVMCAVSEDPHLIATVGFGAHRPLTQRHAQQGSGDLLARAE